MSQSSSSDSLFEEKHQLSLDDDSFNDSQPITQPTNPSLSQFDEFIGLIEEIIVTDEFEALQSSFIDQHCHLFNKGLDSENKLSDSDLHLEYQRLIENFLIDRLKEADPDFTLEALQEAIHAYITSSNQSTNQTNNQDDNLPTDIHEFLASLDDFMSFKSLMCDAYEASQRSNEEGFGLTITSLQAKQN